MTDCEGSSSSFDSPGSNEGKKPSKKVKLPGGTKYPTLRRRLLRTLLNYCAHLLSKGDSFNALKPLIIILNSFRQGETVTFEMFRLTFSVLRLLPEPSRGNCIVHFANDILKNNPNMRELALKTIADQYLSRGETTKAYESVMTKYNALKMSSSPTASAIACIVMYQQSKESGRRNKELRQKFDRTMAQFAQSGESPNIDFFKAFIEIHSTNLVKCFGALADCLSLYPSNLDLHLIKASLLHKQLLRKEFHSLDNEATTMKNLANSCITCLVLSGAELSVIRLIREWWGALSISSRWRCVQTILDHQPFASQSWYCLLELLRPISVEEGIKFANESWEGREKLVRRFFCPQWSSWSIICKSTRALSALAAPFFLQEINSFLDFFRSSEAFLSIQDKCQSTSIETEGLDLFTNCFLEAFSLRYDVPAQQFIDLRLLDDAVRQANFEVVKLLGDTQVQILPKENKKRRRRWIEESSN